MCEQELKAESKRASRLEQVASQQGEELKKLERMQTMLNLQKNDMSDTIKEKEAKLERKTNLLKRLDVVLEEVRRIGADDHSEFTFLVGRAAE